jgi:hypothetical protein
MCVERRMLAVEIHCMQAAFVSCIVLFRQRAGYVGRHNIVTTCAWPGRRLPVDCELDPNMNARNMMAGARSVFPCVL